MLCRKSIQLFTPTEETDDLDMQVSKAEMKHLKMMTL